MEDHILPTKSCLMEDDKINLTGYAIAWKRVYNEVLLVCNKHRLTFCIFLVTVLVMLYQFSVYKQSNCLALLCFNNLCILNVFRALCHLCGLWSDTMTTSSTYSYGLVRVKILMLFSSLILMFMLSVWNIKIIVMSFLGETTKLALLDCFSRSNVFFFGVEVIAVTCLVTFTRSGETLDVTISASDVPSSQIIYRLVKKYLPSPWKWAVLEHLTSMRRLWPQSLFCPVVSLGVVCWLLITLHTLTTSVLFRLLTNSSSFIHVCDAITGLIIIVLMIVCLKEPFVTSFRILMQGIVYSAECVQRSLHEASTIDGVLEIKQTNVWCLATGSNAMDKMTNNEILAGSVLVRLQRNADVATVSSELISCLQGVIKYLTLQVYKDDWLSPLNSSSHLSNSLYDVPNGTFHHAHQTEYLQIKELTSPSHYYTSERESMDVNQSDDQKSSALNSSSVMLPRVKITDSPSPHYVNIEYPLVEASEYPLIGGTRPSQERWSREAPPLTSSYSKHDPVSPSEVRFVGRGNDAPPISKDKNYNEHFYVNIDYSNSVVL